MEEGDVVVVNSEMAPQGVVVVLGGAEEALSSVVAALSSVVEGDLKEEVVLIEVRTEVRTGEGLEEHAGPDRTAEELRNSEKPRQVLHVDRVCTGRSQTLRHASSS